MSGPRYDLGSVKFLASSDCMVPAEASCRGRLKVLFDGPRAARSVRAFCKFVVSKLDAAHFCETIEDMYCDLTGEQPYAYDVYALELLPQQLEEQGIEQVEECWPTTWYVKLAIAMFEGKKVHLVSLHCLRYRIKRADGSIVVPAWDDGYKHD